MASLSLKPAGPTMPKPSAMRALGGTVGKPQNRVNPRMVTMAAAAAETTMDVETAVATLKKAGSTFDVPPVEVFSAMKALEDAKLEPEGYYEKIGGTASPGNRWRLVFTTSADTLKKATKNEAPGGGQYFPITACQKFDASANEIKNGVFFGHLANLTFTGPMEFKGRKLGFTFTKLGLKLGPWDLSFDLPQGEDGTDTRKWPFFLFAYADENIIVARGKGGGIAFWARTTPNWEMENGIVDK